MLRRTGPASGSKTIRSRVHDTLSTVKSGSPLEREHLLDGGTGQRLARLARAAAEVWRQDQSAAPAAPPARAARSRRSRGLRGSAGRAARPGQPPRRRAASRHPGRPRRGRPATTAPHGAPGRRLRLDALPRGPSRARDGQPDRNPRGPSPDPGRSPLGDRAHPRLANQDGKLRWCTEPRRLAVDFWLPLGQPPPPPPMTTYWRSL